MKEKTIYFGYDLMADCLPVLRDSGCEIVKIFTFKTDNRYEFNKKVIGFAEENGIPWTDSKITPEEIETLADVGVTLAVSAGYQYLIPVNRAIRGVNLHPALLPEGRGPWPMPVTILRGIEKSGVTAHKINERFDEGDILLQQPFYVDENETLISLEDKIGNCAPEVLSRVLDDFDYFWDMAIPQGGAGEYWSEPSEAEMTFSPYDSIERISRVTRAFEGYGSIFELNGNKIRVRKATCIKAPHTIAPGAPVVYQNRKCFAVNGGYIHIMI